MIIIKTCHRNKKYTSPLLRAVRKWIFCKVLRPWCHPRKYVYLKKVQTGKMATLQILFALDKLLRNSYEEWSRKPSASVEWQNIQIKRRPTTMPMAGIPAQKMRERKTCVKVWLNTLAQPFCCVPPCIQPSSLPHPPATKSKYPGAVIMCSSYQLSTYRCQWLSSCRSVTFAWLHCQVGAVRCDGHSPAGIRL